MRRPDLHILLASFLLISVLIFGGCSEKLPEDLMSREEMIPVIKDLQIAYAGVDATVGVQSEKEEKYLEMNLLVLEKHQLEKNRFFDSFKWYEAHPVLMDSIYTQVIEQLTRELDSLQKVRKSNVPAGAPQPKNNGQPNPTN